MKKIIFVIFIINCIIVNDILPQSPAMPTNFRGSGIFSTKIKLYWHNNATNATGFEITRYQGATPTTHFVSSTDTTFVDSLLSYSTAYQYRIRSYNANGASNWTPLINITSLFLGEVILGADNHPVDYPFKTEWEDSKTQILIRKADIYKIKGSSSFPSWGFKIFVSNHSSVFMSGYTLKAQLTNDTILTGFKTTGWTTLYNGNYTVPSIGWVNLSPILAYFTVSNNLLIEICYDNNYYVSNSIVNATYNPNLVWHQSGDNAAGCSYAAGTTQGYCPNIMLWFFVDKVKNISSEVPSAYSLSQNYPNPFNNTSNLKFSILNSGNVKLVVYDVMGREVQTLVNERLQVGTYETKFDGSMLNSGVYFYKLITDGFTVTKRMLLIK